MSRIIKIILAVMLLMTASACSKGSSKTEETLKTVPSGFYRKYEKAEFSKFNSYASENGLGGTRVWVEGFYDEVNIIDSDGFHIMHSTLTDDKGNRWLLVLDIEEANSKETFEKLINHRILVIGTYDGYSDVFDMPTIFLNSIYDRNTGNITSSVAYSSMSEDQQPENNVTPPEEKQPEPEPDPEPVKEETGGIRPEIKEAIDAYESFIDEYIAFMKTYAESENSLALLADYVKFAAKLEEYETKMDKLEEELTHEEDIYFLEVVNRCNVKLLESMQ